MDDLKKTKSASESSPHSADPGNRQPADPWTTMLTKFNRIAWWFGKKVSAHLSLHPDVVALIRKRAREGTVVYIMRYPSLIDSLLVNMVLLREGLPLARISNGMSSSSLRPLREQFAVLLGRLIPFRRKSRFGSDPQSHWLRFVALAEAGDPILLFLRGAKLGFYVKRSDAVEARESEKDYLAELVRMQWTARQRVFFVPIAVFWRSGPRYQSSRTALSSIFYGLKERPGDPKKFVAFLLNYHNLLVRFGKPIDLKSFIEERSSQAQGAIVKRIRRALQLFLYREEKSVHGPILKPRKLIRDIVVSDPETQAVIDRVADATGEDVEKVRKRAAKYFIEIAANFRGTFISFLDAIFVWVFRRTFSGLEVTGLETIEEYGKRSPLVLFPCHRSHFDYLIISSLFYHSHLSPPHIAAGINLAFWPMGPLFRGAGAYFLRRSFGDNELYKMVFHKYIHFLIKEGYTQEIFIEGGRSRTGKLLNPRLGMLSMIIDAYIKGARQDLYLMPIGINYERLAEESTYVREMEGKKKETESIKSIVRARSVLKRRFGKVHLNFGQPISLREALGGQLEQLRATYDSAEGETARRTFTEALAYRILRAINVTMTATVSSLAAVALLARDKNAIRRDEFLETVHEFRGLLRVRHARMSAPLAQEDLNFEDMIQFLISSDLIRELKDAKETVYTYDETKRRALDFYKNNIIHFLVVPSILAQALQRPTTRDELWRELFWWVQLFRYEFFLPDERAVQTRAEVYLGHFIAEKLVEESATGLRPRPEGARRLALHASSLANFREGYFAVLETISHIREWPIPEKKLLSEINLTFEKYFLLKEVRRPEARNPVVFRNALRSLVTHEHLVTRQVSIGKGKSSILYDRGSRLEDLTETRRTVARSLKSHDT